MRDYDVLNRELPDDNEVAKSLLHAQVALKKSRGNHVEKRYITSNLVGKWSLFLGSSSFEQ